MQFKTEENLSKNVIIISMPQALTKEGSLVWVQNGKKGLLHQIFEIGNIQWCLISGKTLAVKYKGDNAADIKALLLAEVADYLEENGGLLSAEKVTDTKELAEAIADVYIRPTLNRDKGDINLKLVSATQMEVEFTGHCAGCPYAQNTLQNVVVKTLQKFMPEITKIYLKGQV